MTNDPTSHSDRDNSSPPMTPDEWASQLSGPAELSSDQGPWTTALMRHWRGTSPDMDQPRLDHHYLVQHLGGPKLVRRRREGAELSTVAEAGSLTIVPAGTMFLWHTLGPIEFAHLYMPPAMLSHLAEATGYFRALSLRDAVGISHPLLRSLYDAMLAEVMSGAEADPLYLDSLLDALLRTLLRHYTTRPEGPRRPRETLRGVIRQRLKDYIAAHLSEPISLADLSAIAGASVYHFARAFRNSMGLSPHQYVVRCRIERAQALLADGDLDLASIAVHCGFRDASHLSKTFRRLVNRSCLAYRRSRAGGPHRAPPRK
jgi:AraC family transcriptional regulator